MAAGPLTPLIAHAPPATVLEHLDAKTGEKDAVVVPMQAGYWIRIFGRGSEVSGNRLRDDRAGLEDLLLDAGIPMDAGWQVRDGSGAGESATKL